MTDRVIWNVRCLDELSPLNGGCWILIIENLNRVIFCHLWSNDGRLPLLYGELSQQLSKSWLFKFEMLRAGRKGDKRITGEVCGFKNRGSSVLLPCSLPCESARCPVLLEQRRTGIRHSHGFLDRGAWTEAQVWRRYPGWAVGTVRCCFPMWLPEYGHSWEKTSISGGPHGLGCGPVNRCPIDLRTRGI